MINRDSRGRPYSTVRGEILGFVEDELLRKHSPRMFSLISERKLGIEDDQIPSYVLNHKLCRLGIGRCYYFDPFGTLREIKVFGSGGVWSQG